MHFAISSAKYVSYTEAPARYAETNAVLRGEYSTLNIGEFPNVARESSLLAILEDRAPRRYSLSPRMAEGVLRRVARRGKILPSPLKETLERVVRESELKSSTNVEPSSGDTVTPATSDQQS